MEEVIKIIPDYTFERRMEIGKMLMSGKVVTVRQLMKMYNIGRRSVERDISVIGQYYPIVSARGYNGGFRINGHPTEYQNSLTKEQLDCLYRLLETCDEEDKPIILSIIHEFGPYIDTE